MQAQVINSIKATKMEIKLSNKSSPEKLEFFQAAVQYLRDEHKIFYKSQARRIGMDEKRMQNMRSGNNVRPTDEEINALFTVFRVKLRGFKHPFLIDPEVLPPQQVEKNVADIVEQQEAEVARLKAELKRLKDYIRKGGDLID